MIQSHITTAEAKAQTLPGHDVYRWSSIIYLDELNRNYGAAKIYRHALDILSDTYYYKYAKEIRGEIQLNNDAMKNWKPDTVPTFPHTPILHGYMPQIYLENLKFASCFELVLKAKILEKGHVIHEISNQQPYSILNNLQKKTPILIDNLLQIGQFMFDGSQNYLTGITSKSIQFSTILHNKSYRDLYNLTQSEIELIEEFRDLRNHIHLAGDVLESPERSKVPDFFEFMETFFTSHIIKPHNAIMIKYENPYRLNEIQLF